MPGFFFFEDFSGHVSPTKNEEKNPATKSSKNLQLKNIGSAKTDPVRFKWGFGEGLLKDKFVFFEAYITVLYLRGANCLQNAHFCKPKGPC